MWKPLLKFSLLYQYLMQVVNDNLVLLKKVKNYLQVTLSQENLNSFSILYIYSNVLNLVNYDEVIDTFAAIKARRKL